MNPEISRLKSWLEVDEAMLCIGRALGIIGEDVEKIHQIKPLLWSQNVETRCFHDVISAMVKAGYLEYDEDAVAYRISPQFRPIQIGDSGHPLSPT